MARDSVPARQDVDPLSVKPWLHSNSHIDPLESDSLGQFPRFPSDGAEMFRQGSGSHVPLSATDARHVVFFDSEYPSSQSNVHSDPLSSVLSALARSGHVPLEP